MSLVRIACYKGKRDGSWNWRALMITFATKTPFVVYTYDDHIAAFSFNGRTVVHSSNAPDAYLREIDGGGEARHDRLNVSVFERELAAVVNRLFTPADLDADTPPGVVADWLQDRGLNVAAEILRASEAATPRMFQFGDLETGTYFRFPHEANTPPHVKYCDGGYHTPLANGELSAVKSISDHAFVVPVATGTTLVK